MKFTTKIVTALVATALLLSLEATADGVRGSKTRELQGPVGNAGVTCITKTNADGTRVTVTPCATTAPVVSNAVGDEDEEDEDEEEMENEEEEEDEEEGSNAVAGATTGMVVGPPPGDRNPVMNPDIVIAAMMTPALSSLVRLVAAANLVPTLQGPGPFTVFAPVNSAFPTGAEFTQLLVNPQLGSILKYHVVPGLVPSSALSDGMMAPTAQGTDVTIGVSAAGVTVNGANVIIPDVEVSNGIVHVIDAVLLPGGAPAAPAAPATPATPSTPSTPATPAAPSNTIVDVALGAPDLTTLVELVTLADLAGALAGPGPFTVFAPLNSAFAAVDPAVVSSLTADPAGALTDVLLYHVVQGSIMSSDLTNGAAVTTLGGQPVTVNLTATGAMINNANVVTADIMASNGVVHLIDAVLIPPPNEAAASMGMSESGGMMTAGGICTAAQAAEFDCDIANDVVGVLVCRNGSTQCLLGAMTQMGDSCGCCPGDMSPRCMDDGDEDEMEEDEMEEDEMEEEEMEEEEMEEDAMGMAIVEAARGGF